MRIRNIFRYVLALAILLSLSTSSWAWKFASIADSRGSDNGINAPILNKIIDQINREKVDLVIVAGDLVDAHNSTELAAQLDVWKSAMSRLKCPYYVSVGNHDIPDAGSEDVIRSKFDFPTNGPAGYEELVYSFDYKDAHFVSLDSHKFGNKHRVQRSWLRKDLALNKMPHVFIFSHDPAYPKGKHINDSLDKYPEERDAFWRLISSHGCRTYFCGHEHYYARDEKDGTHQIINGTCGAPIHKGFKGTVDKFHYVIIDVNGANVKGYAKDEEGKQIDSWNYSLK